MKKVERTVYLSKDNIEFDTETKCLAHEARVINDDLVDEYLQTLQYSSRTVNMMKPVVLGYIEYAVTSELKA